MGRRKIKGNMDIELAVDAMELADHLDHIVLFSATDFRSLVEALQHKGKRVSVVSRWRQRRRWSPTSSPPSRPIHRSRQSAKRDRPRSVRAGATRERRRGEQADEFQSEDLIET